MDHFDYAEFHLIFQLWLCNTHMLSFCYKRLSGVSGRSRHPDGPLAAGAGAAGPAHCTRPPRRVTRRRPRPQRATAVSRVGVCRAGDMAARTRASVRQSGARASPHRLSPELNALCGQLACTRAACAGADAGGPLAGRGGGRRAARGVGGDRRRTSRSAEHTGHNKEHEFHICTRSRSRFSFFQAITLWYNSTIVSFKVTVNTVFAQFPTSVCVWRKCL